MKKDRFGVIIFFFILFFIFLEIRIFMVSLAPDQRLKNDKIKESMRGAIYDRNKKELAVSSTFYSLYARPSDLRPDVRNYLYNYFIRNRMFSQTELKDLDTSKSFVWIKRKIQPKDTEKIRSLVETLKKNKTIPKDGLGLLPEQGRIYPQPDTANIVGVVGIDNNGLSGMEYSLNSYLEQGFDIYTSLDPELSKIVYEELKKGIIAYKAEFGSAAVIDTDTREVLALVNFPMYDPNDFKSITSYNIRPRAVADSFEPGSVMKQFSAAYALEKNLVKTNTPIYQCTGFASVGDHEFTCEAAHGYVNLTTILQKSCNIGMIQVADRFNKNDLYRFFRAFGFGTAPAIPLNEMSSGILRTPDRWTMLSKYMLSIGQEIGVSTLQLAIASSVIGGQGLFKTPVLVRSIRDLSENSVFNPSLTNYPVLSPTVTRELLQMMETVVSENGTAIAAKVEGMPISGKTGTGQIAKEDGTGYYKDLYNSVFVGYVPANRPKYVITIVINKPHGDKRAGGLVAAPVFAKILRRMMTAAPYFSSEQDTR